MPERAVLRDRLLAIRRVGAGAPVGVERLPGVVARQLGPGQRRKPDPGRVGGHRAEPGPGILGDLDPFPSTTSNPPGRARLSRQSHPVRITDTPTSATSATSIPPSRAGARRTGARDSGAGASAAPHSFSARAPRLAQAAQREMPRSTPMAPVIQASCAGIERSQSPASNAGPAA
jgi:hypothetical protein